jgi:GPH family glycoside/pentoside/hexuronide:cation symporter
MTQNKVHPISSEDCPNSGKHSEPGRAENHTICREVSPFAPSHETPPQLTVVPSKKVKADDNHGANTGELSQQSKLPNTTKFLLSLGESVQGVWTITAGFYLNTYFLETCCLDPLDVSAIQLLQGLFDSFNDPLIGYLSDHTRSRLGRRRPWLLAGGPILALSYFGLWNKLPNDAGHAERFFFYLACYMGVSLGVTCIQIQIASLTPELTDDYDERTTIGAMRLAFATFCGMVGVALHGIILKHSPNPADGYRISGGIIGIFILICTVTVFCGIREKFVPEQESRGSLGMLQELRAVFGSWPFRCVIVIYLCGPTAIVLVQTNLFMFCKYVLANEDFFHIVILLLLGGAVLSGPFWVLFSRRYGKRECYFLGGPVLAASMFVGSFIRNEFLYAIPLALAGACFAVVYLAPYSLLPDVIEDDEARTGKRREGLFSGFFTISLKLTVTIAMTFTNVILKLAGYRSPKRFCSDAQNNVQENLPDSQPEAVLDSLTVLMGPIPALLVIIAMLFAWLFPITRESHAELVAEVRQRRSVNIENSHNPSIETDAVLNTSDIVSVLPRARSRSPSPEHNLALATVVVTSPRIPRNRVS